MASLVQLTDVSKSYGAVPALADVSLTIDRGIVHAILGENGAGKSTLMKLLAGVVAPDSGAIVVDGTLRRLASPRDAAALGIVCMFQELSLMPHLTVGDNLALSDGGPFLGLIGRRARRAARAALDGIGGEAISLSAVVSDLPLADRQLVEIAKAVHRQPRLLILDEATSALTSERVEKVFRAIQRLRDEGCAAHPEAIDKLLSEETRRQGELYLSPLRVDPWRGIRNVELGKSMMGETNKLGPEELRDAFHWTPLRNFFGFAGESVRRSPFWRAAGAAKRRLRRGPTTQV